MTDTFENHVNWAMAAWSGTMPSRKDALEHLFLVIGNGYEWENGKLVDSYDKRSQEDYQHRIEENRKAARELRQRLAKLPKDQNRDTKIADDILKIYNHNAPSPYNSKRRYPKVRNKPNPLREEYLLGEGQIPKEHQTTFYPFDDEYSRAASIPSNVRCDWLGGAIEALDMVVREEKNERQRELAKKLLKQIDERQLKLKCR